MHGQDSQQIAVALVRKAGVDADGARVAESIVLVWQAIDSALGPVIGRGGVAALYKRSLYLTDPDHPWLAALHEVSPSRLDLAALRELLAREDSADAVAAAGGAVLHQFDRLLATLIGPLLTERLLRAVWEDFSSRPLVQDPPP